MSHFPQILSNQRQWYDFINPYLEKGAEFNYRISHPNIYIYTYTAKTLHTKSTPELDFEFEKKNNHEGCISIKIKKRSEESLG